MIAIADGNGVNDRNVHSVNSFFSDRIIFRGVGDSLAPDPQAIGLGEFVRARRIDIPEELLR